jgi:hypothetical protein
MLTALGLTEKEFKALRKQAIELAGTTEVIPTEFGTVQIVPDKPVDWRIRRKDGAVDPFPKKRIILLKKEE